MIQKHRDSQWVTLATLGIGGFGKVIKAQKICDDLKIEGLNNNICAIKIIKNSVFTKNEIEILKQLDHPLIVKYYGYAQGENPNDDNIYIYMEYIEGFPISTILKKRNNYFEEDIIRNIVCDLAMILNYIHDDRIKIIHRDLKCDNIMLVHDGCNIGNNSSANDKQFLNCSTGGTSKITGYGEEKQQLQIKKKQQKLLQLQQKEIHEFYNCGGGGGGGQGQGQGQGQEENQIIEEIIIDEDCYSNTVDENEKEQKNLNHLINNLRTSSLREINGSCESCSSEDGTDSTKSISNNHSPDCIYSSNKKIKLIDFGLSKACDGDSKYYSLVGTLTHLPPEVVLRNNTACRKSDIWSLGCTIIEMAGGNLIEKDNLGKPKIPEHLSFSCKNFIQRCLTVDPNHREDILTLITHNFISNKIKDEEIEIKEEDRVKLVDNIPSCKSKIEFDDEFNEQIHPGEIPSSVQEIVFGFDFNKQILVGSFDQIKTIEFGGSFNKVIPVGSLPSATSITFGARYNKPLIMDQFPCATTINFGWMFNQTLTPGYLPSSLTKLTFQEGANFNRPLEIGSLPNSLTTLILSDYNSPIPSNVLSNSIKTLEIGGEFNYPLQGCLPSSLTSLKLGYAFNQPLTKDCIPGKVKSLTFGSNFNQVLEPNVLPSSIESLYLGYYYNKPLVEGSIPSSVTTLSFEYRDTLKKVSLDYIEITNRKFDFEQQEIEPLTPESLPESITKLSIGKNVNHLIEFNCLPPDLLSLKYHGGFSKYLIPRDIPNSVTSLKLYNYNFEIKKNSIPRSVTSLQLGSRYFTFKHIGSLSNLSPNLRDLKIYINIEEIDIYNLKDIIPSTITYLEINGDIIDLPIGIDKKV